MQLLKYGKCNIEVPVKSIPRLLVEEVLKVCEEFMLGPFSDISWVLIIGLTIYDFFGY